MKTVFNQQQWKIEFSGKTNWYTVCPVNLETADL